VRLGVPSPLLPESSECTLPAEGEGERPAMALIHFGGLRYWIESLILAQDKRWRRA
jgi:hypothetical protein